MYFRLNNNVFSIGEKNVILYDISMQRYFMLDRRGSRAINACESNSRIEDIPVNQFKLKRFLDILAEKKLENILIQYLMLKRIYHIVRM